jgi:hypothetical protein
MPRFLGSSLGRIDQPDLLRQRDLLGGEGGFFGRRASIGAAHCPAVFGNHLPDLGDALTALGLAPHAVKEAGRGAHALGERLLDLLLIKSVADADIHDRLNPADDAQWLEQLRMSVNRYIHPASLGALRLVVRHRSSLEVSVFGLVPWMLPRNH